MIVRFTDQAIGDLSSIRVYLAEHSPNAADRIGQRLVQATDGLGVSPIAEGQDWLVARERSPPFGLM
jgi:plasmid stabilization system protein ParE